MGGIRLTQRDAVGADCDVTAVANDVEPLRLLGVEVGVGVTDGRVDEPRLGRVA